MKKKIYMAPNVKVRKIEGETMLAGSGEVKTGFSDKPATGGGLSKGNAFSDEEDDAPSYHYNAWGD